MLHHIGGVTPALRSMLFAGLSLMALPAPAHAGPVCSFTQECFETLECTDADYVVEIDLENQVLSTLIEDMPITYIEASEGLLQLTAKGMGAMNMLTIAGTRGLLSVHIGAGPSLVSYYGECEERD